MKKILFTFLILISFFSLDLSYALTEQEQILNEQWGNREDGNYKYSNNKPKINCAGLPGCNSDGLNTSGDNTTKNIGIDFFKKIIGEFIQIVSVFAVFALIFSGVMYLLSSGEEEKANKAKKWIIWSLVGVFLSISAWGIINFLNNIKIN